MNLNERRKHVTAIESHIYLLTNHVVYTAHHAVHRVPTTGYCHVSIDSYVYIAKIARKAAWKRKKGEETVICAISIGNDDDKEMKFSAWSRPQASLPPRIEFDSSNFKIENANISPVVVKVYAWNETGRRRCIAPGPDGQRNAKLFNLIRIIIIVNLWPICVNLRNASQFNRIHFYANIYSPN